MSSYEAKVKVVRQGRQFLDTWYEEDGRWTTNERAYLVRGLPMPGEKVRTIGGGMVREVRGILPLVFLDGANRACRSGDLTPYDPDAEKVERVAKAIYRDSYPQKPDCWEYVLSEVKDQYRDRARAAIAAMEDE